MRGRTLLALAAVLVVIVGAQPVLAITWGQPDGNLHPNVGAMMVEMSGSDAVEFPVCSGTLIDPNIFLTAGHCTEVLKAWIAAGRITAYWVSFDPDPVGKTRLAVEEIVTHPDYNWGPTSNPHDVGALILEEPVAEEIVPANLPPEGFLDDLKAGGQLHQGKNRATFVVVGYGATLDWPPPAITYEDQRQYAVSEYRVLLKAWLRVSQNPATSDGGTCYGDSGGPSFYTWTNPSTQEEIDYLVGITSWGDAQCVACGFNYRVDIPETLGFIDELIDGEQ